MALPTFTDGNVVTAAQLNAVLPIAAVKPSDQAVTSSTTLVNDSALLVAVAASATYEVNLFLTYTATGSSSTGGIKVAWTAPSGAVLNWVPYLNGNSDGVQQLATVWTTGGTLATVNPGSGTGASMVAAHVYGVLIMGVNAGSLQLQWAQNTSNASATTVKAGSALIVRQIA